MFLHHSMPSNIKDTERIKHNCVNSDNYEHFFYLRIEV